MCEHVDRDTIESMTRTAVTPPVDRMRRRSGGKIVAGVCGGIADHLGVDVFRVRVVFVALAALAGAGVAAYALLWFFCPTGEDTTPPPTRERRQAQGLLIIGVIVVLLNGFVASSAPASTLLALVVVLGGAGLVWREVDVTGFSRRSGVVTWLRVAAGAFLVVGGLVVLVAAPDTALAGMNPTLLAVLGTLFGTLLLTVPLWMRMWRTLNAERAARIRNQEREEIASHLHDSVLQTLALIQKRADQPDAVARLARRQERELRQWLFGDESRRRESLAAAVAAISAEVEDGYGIEVETVTVGDVTLEELRDKTVADGLQALVAAAREAMVNAAKHSGADKIDVFCEVDDERVEVFVRDRGKGFDPDAVDPDRQGISKSISARMERVGGTARITSAPGRGTNIGLSVPRGPHHEPLTESDPQPTQEIS